MSYYSYFIWGGSKVIYVVFKFSCNSAVTGPRKTFGRFSTFTLTPFNTLHIFCPLLGFLPVLECHKSSNTCGYLRVSEPTEVHVCAHTHTHTHTGLTILI